jgi:hypothetical protein
MNPIKVPDVWLSIPRDIQEVGKIGFRVVNDSAENIEQKKKLFLQRYEHL